MQYRLELKPFRGMAGAATALAMVVACGVRGANSPPPHGVRYCFGTVLEWDVPRCLVEVSPELQRRCQDATRISYDGDRPVRLETVNGLGLSDSEPSDKSAQRYVYDGSRVAEVVHENRNGVVLTRWVISKDREWMRVLDVGGRPRVMENTRASGFKRKFDARGRVISMTYIDANGMPTAGLRGIVEIRTQYDDRGAELKSTSFDERGQPMYDDDGVHSTLYARNEQGLIVNERYLTSSGQSWARSDGVSRVQYSYDGAGNVVDVRYEDAAGHLHPAKQDGAARFHVTYDARGLEIERTYFDALDQPVISSYGFVTRRQKHDERGLVIELSFHDAKGRPTRRSGDFSIMRRTLDARGRATLVTTFDERGRPTPLVPWGYQRAETTYDERDNPTLITYEDERGLPVRIHNGFAKVRYYYDGDRLIRTEYLSESAELTEIRNGQARELVTYDALGVASVSLFDKNGKKLHAPEDCPYFRDDQAQELREALKAVFACGPLNTAPGKAFFFVDAEGRASQIDVRTESSPIEACVRRVIAGAALPKPQGECGRVGMELSFSPQ